MLVLEQAPGSVFIMDNKMNFEYLNPMFTKLSGYTNEDLLHKNINETIYKGKMPESRAGVGQALAKGEKWQGELLTYQKTGESYWANTIAAPYKDESGNVEGYVVIQQDITERKNMELALRESEQLYRTLIEKSLNGVALTVNRRFSLVNQALCNIVGYTMDELLAMDPTELLAHDDRERVLGIHDKRMSGEVNTLSYTAKFVHKTGKLITVEMNSTTVQVNGQNASFVTLRDVTEQHALKNALELSVQKYHDLADLLPQTVYELDMHGKIVFMNQAGINAFGKVLPSQDLFALDFIAPEDQQRLIQNIQASYQGKKPDSGSEYIALRADGSRYPIMVYSSPVFTNGVQTGTRGIIIDISERKAIENALRESESKYKTLVENSQDGILIIRDDKVLFANKTIAKLMDYNIDEFYRMPSINLLHPDDRYKAARIAEKRRNQDFSTINEEFRMVTRNGEVKDCETSSTLIEFDGQWASFFTIQDITESKRMQLDLKENEEKYRQLFAAESDAIFMIDADTGEILDANPATSLIYGYSHDELLLMKNTDVSAEPEKTSEATQNHLNRVPIRYHKKKNGTIFPVELSAGFTRMGNRNIQIVTSRDITDRIQNQEALSKSEQKYRELTEMLPQAIYELDAQGNPKYMNKAGLKIFGIENGSGDKKAFDFFVPEDMQRMKQALKIEADRMADDEGILEPVPSDPMEFTAQRPDGSRFPVLIYGTSIIENGEIKGSRGMIIDISERKAMENALRESESKYKTLIENSQDGVFAIIGDKIEFVNSTLCKMLGYSAEELYNMPAINMVVPEDRQRGMEISERRKMGDWSTVNDIFHFQAKDGSVRECDTFSSILELNGQIVSYITVHDLTETRRMQEQLKLSEEKYRNLIENATDGIVIVQDGFLKFANQTMCDIMKYNLEELIDKPFLDYIDEADHDSLSNFHNRRMTGEQFSNILRSHFIRKDGKMITVELNARTSNYKGRPAGFIVIRDITDRLKIENELQTAKHNLEMLNRDLEQRVIESSESLTEARTQLINLQKENLQSQFDVLKQQVNPHFLFNSLNVLTSLIKLEPDLAEKFSEHLSKVYRYVLENKDNELVDLNTELVFLDAYIFLLNIRFVNKLHVNINIPDSKRSYQVIPLAMQLLIENAIKHNIMSKSNPLQIDIFIDNRNFLNIVNNLQERPSQIVSTGVGLKNIQNRYLLLNNTEPVFEKTKTHFIAKVPLVKID